MSLVDYEIIKNEIGLLTFNNPKTLNTFDFDVINRLSEVLDKIKKDNNIGCLIMTGAGDKAFIAGGDIKTQYGFNVEKAHEWALLGYETLRKIERLQIPVIGAINGYALGGGTEMALTCDILVASEKAIFAQPEITLGIIPGYGGTQRLPRKIGLNKAKELILTGRRFNAQEALEIGLVNYVVPHENLMEKSIEIGDSIIKNSRFAVKMVKMAIDEGIQGDLDRGLIIERGAFCSCFSTREQKDAMKKFIDRK